MPGTREACFSCSDKVPCRTECAWPNRRYARTKHALWYRAAATTSCGAVGVLVSRKGTLIAKLKVIQGATVCLVSVGYYCCCNRGRGQQSAFFDVHERHHDNLLCLPVCLSACLSVPREGGRRAHQAEPERHRVGSLPADHLQAYSRQQLHRNVREQGRTTGQREA